MKTETKTKRHVHINLTPAGQLALHSLKKKLGVSQSEAAEYAIKRADQGGGFSSEELSRIEAKFDELIERL